MKLLVIGLGRVNVKNKDGGAIRLYHILKFLLQKGADVTVIIPKRDYQNFQEYGINCTYRLIDDPKLLGDHILLLYVYRVIRVLRLISREKIRYDIVYSLSDFFHDTFPAFYYKLKYAHSRLVINLYLVMPSPLKRYEDIYSDKFYFPTVKTTLLYLSQSAILYVARTLADKVMVLNELDRLVLLKQGFGSDQIEVVSMGIEYHKPQSVIGKVNDCVYLGRFHAQKGISDLVEIWSLIQKQNPSLKLAVIGGGSDQDISGFKIQIHKEGLDNSVNYVGYKDGPEKIRILRQSKILLVPSHYESWGQVIAEGMAQGIPVIAYDLPHIRSVFGNQILYVKRYDTAEFAQITLDLLRDGRRWKKLSEEALNFVGRYSWPVVSEKEFVILKNLLNNRP